MRVLVAAALVVALLAGVIIGAGWQKVQPVEINVQTYSGTQAIHDDLMPITTEGKIDLWPIYDRNVSFYEIKIKN
jgi:hypothetical protein